MLLYVVLRRLCNSFSFTSLALDWLIICLFKLRLQIRAGRLRVRCVFVDASRIGPLAEKSDLAIRWRHIYGDGDAAWFALSQQAFVNHELGAILGRYLNFVTDREAFESLARWRNWMGHFPDFVFHEKLGSSIVPEIYSRVASIVSLTEDEKQRGANMLEKRFGIGPEDTLVCFHARDNGYLESAIPEREWTYHDYRDSRIQNCMLAARAIVDRGWWAVRVGVGSTQRMPSSGSPRIIDYVAFGTEPFLDIYLLYRCRFFLVGGGSGIGFVAQLFGRPVIWANFLPVHPWPWSEHDIFLPKLLRDSEGRLLDFDEMKDLGLFSGGGTGYLSDFYRQRCLTLVENDEVDLADVVTEMITMLDAAPSEHETANLQRAFREKYGPSKMNGAKIGGRFLKRHERLFRD